MSLARGFTWHHKDLSLVGYSLAGISTSVGFPQADVCFDVGQGLPFQIPFNNIALTHGHLDHAGGLPYLLGQKAMHSAKPPSIYMPHSLVGPMKQILALWAQIEDHTYNYRIEGLGLDDERPLKGKFFLKPFPTFHRIPSQGYTVFQHKKRLLPQYQGATHIELGNARREGHTIDEAYVDPIVSFTGDTKIEVLQSETVRRSRVILLECTYWDVDKTVENAREWGHIHFDEVLPWLDRLECEKLLLMHSSVRYPIAHIQEIIRRKVPAEHLDKIELFGRSPGAPQL